ncbi:MAG TPA: HD domain-containing phosphohydrolase [Pseudomonadales bacterium]|nr:HD domain-containing phosphohydrolase [Pseudomonadales bacterium]
MSLRKITIEDLKPGMFVTELDVPWIKSPFFRHRRLIKNDEDVLLLRQAGVKTVIIDSDKGLDSEERGSGNEPVLEEKPVPTAFAVKSDDADAASPALAADASEAAAEPEKRKPVALTIELRSALKIEKEIHNAVEQINEQVEKGQPIDAAAFTPIIDKTLESLSRNDQALLTLLHQSHTDKKVQAHSFGVFTVALLLALDMGIPQDQQEALGMAALLHDGGWAKLPANLFSKGKAYSETEKTLVKQHLLILDGVLKKSNLPEMVTLLIQQHHERSDGSGYPRGLKEAQIHPLARLLGAADQYDELIHGLGEKPGVIPSVALSILFKESKQGIHDPRLIARLVQRMGVYPIGSAVKLNTGEKALVIETTREEPLLPRIKIYYDRSGAAMLKPKEVDLLKEKPGESARKIEGVINPEDPGQDPARLLRLASGE